MPAVQLFVGPAIVRFEGATVAEVVEMAKAWNVHCEEVRAAGEEAEREKTDAIRRQGGDN